MSLLNREWLCNKLALSRWQSYKVFPATKTGLLRETDVLAFLNHIRVGLPDAFSFVPQLSTAEEIEAETTVPKSKLLLWAKRNRTPIPHFRINSHTLRYPKNLVIQWLEEQSK